jgi:5'(3')-deoxyribonucleotidase
VYILSTAPWKNPTAASDKVAWVTKYLDDVFHKRMVITHCKNLCKGDYLIDDRGKNGTSEFEGEWIHFGSERFPDWESVLDYLLASERCTKASEHVRLRPSSSKDFIVPLEKVFTEDNIT